MSRINAVNDGAQRGVTFTLTDGSQKTIWYQKEDMRDLLVRHGQEAEHKHRDNPQWVDGHYAKMQELYDIYCGPILPLSTTPRAVAAPAPKKSTVTAGGYADAINAVMGSW